MNQEGEIGVFILWIALSFGILSLMTQKGYQDLWIQVSALVVFWLLYLGIAYTTYRYR